MRRTITAAFAALVLSAPTAGAAGRTAVVVVPHPQQTTTATNPGRGDVGTVGIRLTEYITSFLNAHGADYDIVPARFVQTSLVRRGLITGWNGDTAYAAVIWSGLSAALSTNAVAGCYPCSLTITGMLPTVPQAFFGNGISEIEFTASTSCSLMNTDSQDPTSQGPSYSMQRVHIAGSKDVFGWIPGAQGSTVNEEKDSTTTGVWPAGGTRVVMGASWSSAVTLPDGASASERAANVRPAWRDSTFSTEYENRRAGVGGSTAQFPDIRGMYIADRMNAHKADTTFSPIVYGHWLATATATTGGDDSGDLRPVGNPFVVWAAIAHLDSISGFAVLGRSPKPVRIGIQVSHGLKRGAWNAPGGLRPSDPNFANAVDSLAALGVPFAVGLPAEADTLATYADDLTTWRRAPLVKFALNPVLGTKDTTVVGAGNASTTKPFDLFGRYRSRVFYAASTEDTSVYEMLVAAKARLDSLVGTSRVDRMLMAGSDDYTPRNWPGRAAVDDSLASIALLAGFSGIAVNPEEDSLDAVTPTNPRGEKVDVQRWARGSIGAKAGERFTFAAFPGYNPRGAVYGNGGGNTALLDDSCWVNVYAHRAIRGLYLPWWSTDYKYNWVVNNSLAGMSITWLGEPTSSYVSRNATVDTGTNLVRITASSLGYGGDGPSADMPGFYQIKYTVNMAKAINALNGRTLIRFVYPGDIGPDDVRRQ